MKTTFLRAIGGMSLVVSLLFFGSVLASGQGEGGRIVGTWDAQITIRDCASGATIRTFPSIGTFMSGGTFLDSTAGIPQAQKTPGHGVWRHLSGDTYRFSFKSFSFDAATNNFTGWTKITHEATLNSKATEYSSEGIAEVFAPNGVLVFTGCSTTTATRFE